MKSRTMVVLSTACVLAAMLAAWKGGLFAAERRPAAEPTPVEDPRPDEESKPVVVAIVDTGVDAGNAGLKELCLPGVNVAEPGEPVTDPVGHGTAVALLIRHTWRDRAWSGVRPK